MNTYPEQTGRSVLPRARVPARAGLNQRTLRFAVLLFALILLINGAMFVYLNRLDTDVVTPRSETSQGVIQAIALDGGRFVAANLSNEVLLVEGGEVVNSLPFPTVVGGLAARAADGRIYVGTTDGLVTILDDQLQPLQEVMIGGRIVGLEAPPQGGFLVAHGVGAYSDRYWVSYVPEGDDQPAWSTQADFTISALAMLADGTALFSTLNSRVAALDANGQERWKVTLGQPPTELEPLPDGSRVLVGDDRGNLTLLGQDGTPLWVVAPTQYPIRSIAHAPEDDVFFAGDEHGSIFAVNDVGGVLLSQQVTQGNIDDILPLSGDGGLLAVPRNGAWLSITPQGVTGAGTAIQLRTVWIGLNAGLIAALLAALVLAVERWRRALAQQLRFAFKQRAAYIFILPSLLLILVFSYYPAAMAFYHSFTNFSARGVTELIGLDNYVKLLRSDFYFRVGFGNMALIILTNLIKTMTVPLLVAELIFALRKEVHRYVFRTLFVLPAVVPSLITVYLWRMVYDPYAGLLNQLLGVFGMDHLQRAWLGNEQTALWAIIGAGFPYISAFPFLIFMGGLLNISQELYDAAKIDGATWWSRFWRIDVPLLIPQFRLLAFFSFSGAIQGFAHIFIYTRGGPGYATYVPGLQMYYRITEGDFGYASAIGVVLFMMVLIGTIFILRFRREAFEVQ